MLTKYARTYDQSPAVSFPGTCCSTGWHEMPNYPSEIVPGRLPALSSVQNDSEKNVFLSWAYVQLASGKDVFGTPALAKK